jgi:hypothetical protein
MRHAEGRPNEGAEKRSDTPTGYTESKGVDDSRGATRKPILGIPGYKINAAGIPWKWDREMRIEQGIAGLPVIFIFGEELLLDEVVARAFFGPPPINIRGMTVVHFDGDDFNCRVDNLAWRECPEW